MDSELIVHGFLQLLLVPPWQNVGESSTGNTIRATGLRASER